MNPAQVKYIRLRFQTNPHWEELARHHPGLVAGLNALPDEMLIRRCNWLIREIFDDAKRECGALSRNVVYEG